MKHIEGNFTGVRSINIFYQAWLPAGKVKAVLFDNTEPILNAIEEGLADSAIVQRAYMMAYLGVKLLHSWNHRTAYLDRWARAGTPALPYAIDTGVMVITRARISAFR